MQELNKYRVFTLKTAIQDLPKWKFLNTSLHLYLYNTLSRSNLIIDRTNISLLIFSNALLLLYCYYNTWLQYNCIKASAIPPRDYSCKGKAEVSFFFRGDFRAKKSTIPVNFTNYSCKILNAT